MSKNHAQQLTEYLRDNDAPCPRCAYNLRNSPSHRCPECGLDFSLIPVPHLTSIHADSKLERRLIRIAGGCVLIIGIPACMLTFVIPLIEIRLITVMIFAGSLAIVIYAERTTTKRHIVASKGSFYDGTTRYGTYSLLVIAILGFPTVVIVWNLLLGLAESVLFD
ncbi:MAG: hypothetical protein ACF8LL_07630 [Phycisphaerales bacterium]